MRTSRVRVPPPLPFKEIIVGLTFKNKVFRDGYNITVRRGTYWHNRNDKYFSAYDGKKYLHFKVTSSKVKRFRERI